MMIRLLPVLLAAAVAAACGDLTAEEYVDSGNQYFEQKQYREAAVEYQNAVRLLPKMGEARLRLADTLMELHDLPNAARQYVVASDLMPDHLDAQLRAAAMLVLARDFANAKKTAERALRLDRNNVVALVLRANALAGLAQFKEALEGIQQAIALDPSQGLHHQDLGVLQYLVDADANAEASFQRAIELNPTSPEPVLALAGYYWATARFDDAEATLKRSLQVGGDTAAGHRALATFYMGRNRAAEAERHLQAVADTEKSVAARLALADYYLAMRRNADAVAVLEALSKDKEGYGDARSRIAAIEYGAQRTREAHAIIDEAIAADATHPRVLLTKGQFLLVEEKIDEALEKVKSAADFDPGSLHARYTLASIYASRRNVADAIKTFNDVLRLAPTSVAPRVELARLHLMRGDAKFAAEFAYEASKARPYDPGVRALLVRALLATGDLRAAGDALRPLLTDFPENAEVHWLAGVLAVRNGDAAAGRRAFETALRYDASSFEALDSLVALELTAGNHARAKTLVEERVGRQPKHVPTLVLAGRFYQVTGDHASAERMLVAALDIDRSNPALYEMLGAVYLAQNKLDRALVEFQGLLKQDPRSPATHTMIGTILHVQGRRGDAQAAYQRALEADPTAVVAANNLAWLYAEDGGNLDLALQWAQAAKAQAPEQADVNDTLGWVYLKKDLATLAVPAFKASVDADPRNPTYQYHLGLAYAKTGDSRQAREALTAALDISRQFPGADDAQRVLASLR